MGIKGRIRRPACYRCTLWCGWNELEGAWRPGSTIYTSQVNSGPCRSSILLDFKTVLVDGSPTNGKIRTTGHSRACWVVFYPNFPAVFDQSATIQRRSPPLNLTNDKTSPPSEFEAESQPKRYSCMLKPMIAIKIALEEREHELMGSPRHPGEEGDGKVETWGSTKTKEQPQGDPQ